jgi:L-2-hydroxyglutarate oxidase
MSRYEVAVIGGGIVGLASAVALLRRRQRSLVVLEAEAKVAAHQTGHNSGVIHAGVYYRPGSLKARLCTDGRARLYRFCEERGIRHARCGKLIVATNPRELRMLDELERRAHANGLAGLRRCGPEELREREPHAAGMAALLVPDTGVVDYAEVALSLADVIVELGGEVRLGARLTRVGRERDGLLLEATGGAVRAQSVVNCAGLQSDRVARLCGLEPGLSIVPFRGEYYHLRPSRASLVHGLIYPVPDPALPFLGVHFTRTISGTVEAGPNAVLALARHGYAWSGISPADLADMVGHIGFWRMARRHWRLGLTEIRRSLSKRAFVEALRRLLPEITVADLEPGGAGVRAQAVASDGKLLDDFHFVEGPGTLHVLNAPSPAATASLAIGEVIADRAERLSPAS